jgi:hypothetical protein
MNMQQIVQDDPRNKMEDSVHVHVIRCNSNKRYMPDKCYADITTYYIGDNLHTAHIMEAVQLHMEKADNPLIINAY